MKQHIIILYVISITALLITLFRTPTPNQSTLGKLEKLENKTQKIEFYQEATRVMNNLVGFEQVKESQTNEAERAKQCKENQDLLKEWGDDVTALKNLNSDYVSSDNNAKTLLEQTQSLYEQIKGDCAKLATK